MLEATIALPVMLFLVLNGVLLVLGLYRMLAVQNLLNRSIRQIIVDGRGNSARLGRAESLALEIGNVYGIHLSPSLVQVCPTSSPPSSTCAREGAGLPSQYFSMRVDTSIPLLTGLQVPYSFTVLSKNEPF